MTTYTITEYNEKRGTIIGETFNSLNDAIKSLEVSKFMAERHGRIVKSAVKSFTWEFEDQYYTRFRSTYKIEKNG